MKAKMLSSVDPSTLFIIGEVCETPIKEVEVLVQNAHLAFPAWRDKPLKERAAVIKRAQQLLLQQNEEFSRAISIEMGRPINESFVLEVTGCIDILGYYAKNAVKFLGDRKVPLHNLLFKRRKSSLHFEPLGVLGIITPWNWPLLIPMGGIVPALLSGNCVVFKHSEYTPLLAERLRDLFHESGVPEDVFQIVQGGGKQGQALVDSSVEKIFFTGSTNVGRKIYEHAAGSLKKCVLEMGGSDPAIVCEDADPDYASSGILWGGFCNCGQNCNSIERVYVHEKIAGIFLEQLMLKMKKLRIGNGEDPETDIGPLSSSEQLSKIEGIIKRSIDLGAQLLCGGRRLHHLRGFFHEPTLLFWEDEEGIRFKEEIFGPVINVVSVSSDEEAIRLANDSEFGLASSVWTSDMRRGMRIARQIEAGTVMINDVIVSFGMAEAGWTGIKNSGIGWVHGEKGLEEMVNIKYINHDPQDNQQNLWWFPYSLRMLNGMKAGVSFLYSSKMIVRFKVISKTIKVFAGYLLFNKKIKHKL